VLAQYLNFAAMKKLLVLILAAFYLLNSNIRAQDTGSGGKALNIPLRKYGLSFGNSAEFNGIRFNYADSYVQRINGINFTLWTKFKTALNPDAVVNGLSVGTIVNAKKIRPLGVFLVGAAGCESVSGLSLAGIGIASSKLNGISVCGLMLGGDVINGLTVSSLFSNASRAVNGLNVSGLAVMSEGDINGLAAAIAGIYGKETIRGCTLTAGYLQAGTTFGLTVAGYARIYEVHGLTIALVNKTTELHGVQLGLLNFAGNNRKGLRLMPLLNMHFN
jgi:hypothetical protein